MKNHYFILGLFTLVNFNLKSTDAVTKINPVDMVIKYKDYTKELNYINDVLAKLEAEKKGCGKLAHAELLKLIDDNKYSIKDENVKEKLAKFKLLDENGKLKDVYGKALKQFARDMEKERLQTIKEEESCCCVIQ